MKLKNEVSDRIKEKIKLLKSRVGHNKLMSDLLYPARKKEEDRQIAEEYANRLDKKIKQLEPLIRSLHSHIDYIGDPDKFVACYLLIGKTYTSLKAVSVLMRQGYAFQIVELIRSSMESLSLVSLFLDDGQGKKLQEWFDGKIIGNATAREALHDAINKMSKANGGDHIPMKDALSDVYSIYSAYTHSGYSALFDFIDVFVEDFDFQQYSQFHYNRKYFHLIDHLYVNILLSLKNFYIHAKDEENLARIQTLLASEGESFANPEEINEELQRYK